MATVEFTQVVSRGCGMDIHKEVVVATVSGTGLRKETRSFNTFTSSLTELREWLISLGVTHVAMESTGVYWKPIYNVFEGYIPNIWIVNARHIKNVPGHKTDKKDSEWICQLLMAGLLKPSFIPPREQRELRDLTRLRRKVIQGISANKNRIIRTLEDGNVKLSSVLSDTSGKTATELIEMLCDGKVLTLEDVESVRSLRCHHSAEEMLEACTGYMTPHKIYVLQRIRECNRKLTEEVKELDGQIKSMLRPFASTIERLCKIPGIQNRVCEDLIAEIGLDMSTFPSASHLCSWAGVCPGNNESAGKKKSSRTTHGDKNLRATLVEAAWAASRTKETFFAERFSRLAIKKGTKKALIAIAHSILTAVYHVLADDVDYVELGSRHVPDKLEKKRKDYLKSELRKLGYEVTLRKKDNEEQQ